MEMTRSLLLMSSKLCSLLFLLMTPAGVSFMHLKPAHAQLIPVEEVQTLRAISIGLNNRYWKVDRKSCSGGDGLNVNLSSVVFSNVTCKCSFVANTVCHVTNIQLKGLNLTGVIPPEFGDLDYLQEIDLSRNYINGSIPINLFKAPLTILAAVGNRISGSIPKEIGNMTTLEELVLENNQLGGRLPESLGNITRMRRLVLSANDFTGTIPDAFAKLKNLTDFRIDGTQISGKMPALIGNWTNINRLDMQGTSMEGPIPPNITSLTSLTQLRISDLSGSNSGFPNFQKSKDMKILILRNCLIEDSIPDYFGQWTKLKLLDLSFNRLTGEIPGTIQSLDLDYLFLSNNSLSGTVPDWILSSKNNYDISYNNFTGSALSSCQQSDVNVISSYASSESNQVPWCFKKDLPCSQKPQYTSLFINCGGSRATFEGNQYEEDLTTKGPSTFFSSSEKWAYSSTGVYNGKEKANYIARNTAIFSASDAKIYGTARLSPGSLKYFGLCLQKGSYSVRLHFAEIMFSEDKTFSSLGRRIFDVSIQGKSVMKDFNIEDEANGVGKGIVKEFSDISIDGGGTLEIHLYWSGKGTTAIPDKGVYGPLISAISVTSARKSHGKSGLSAGATVGIVILSCVVLGLILIVLGKKGCLCRREPKGRPGRR